MSDESTPNVMDMENSPETANYRKSRLMLWETIIAAYKDYVADGMKVVEAAKAKGATNPSEADVRKAAGNHIRGEVRALCTDILTRAPITAIVQFLERAPNWADESERLIDDGAQNAAIVELITSSYPHRTWAKKIDILEKQRAIDDASWTLWVKTWGEEFGAAAQSVVQGAGEALGGAGEALGGAGKALGGLGEGVGTLLRWAPYLLVGGTVLGVATVIAVTARK